MALVAPNTAPPVTPTPIKRQGSVWVVIGSFLGFLAEHFNLIPLPVEWQPALPFIGAFLAWAAHQKWGPDEYEPTPPPAAPPAP